ncbi:DNA polymerase V [Pontibacter ummariensis]|uniref:DNA polymerase V n=1 Tax=Pontibacter ummariensis TaxID=1610492 RepID=A0A239DW60_9BACT|nr:Y-family DNA polymerase [Pontibacter ummariensis]PRY13733.1 DNA polymerase V [Pontibacter ummariensis]SNS36479.1 DNA polymerase V [Pontibacter ummariensis]
MTSLFAIVDGNNFYASCERVFNPELEGRPVVVLSNNDGAVIARSNEAKALGIKMGVPAFEIKDLVRRHDIKVLSSNYELYGDMSRRVVETLSRFTPNLEIYSIDESFLDLGDFYNVDLNEYARTIKETVKRWTGIPVAVGVAPSKTLAKVANRISKKSAKANGVLVLTDERHIEEALKRTEVADVWGIGPRYTRKLAAFGITTAWHLRNVTDAFARKHLTVVGLRTVRELRGMSCIDLEMVPAAKQNICTSRSFGKTLTELGDIRGALATHTVRCASKLRSQKSCAGVLTVFLQTSRFNDPGQCYFNSRTIKLDCPTSSELELLRYATGALQSIYREGYRYKKAGIILQDIVPDNQVQLNLLCSPNIDRDMKLMRALDSLRDRFGHKSVRYGVQGIKEEWALKQENVSPCFTTRLEDIIRVRS